MEEGKTERRKGGRKTMKELKGMKGSVECNNEDNEERKEKTRTEGGNQKSKKKESVYVRTRERENVKG